MIVNGKVLCCADHLFRFCWGKLTVMFYFNLKLLVPVFFFFFMGRKQYYLEEKTFSSFVSFSEICDIIIYPSTFITVIFSHLDFIFSLLPHALAFLISN